MNNMNDINDLSQTPFPPAAHSAGKEPNWVVSIIDDPTEADRAVDALRAAGVPGENIHILHGQKALDVAQAHEDAKNPIAKLISAWGRASTDPGTAEEEYLDAARQGHSLVNVRAASPEDVQRAREVLLAHHAHHVKHFGKWVSTDLS